MLRRLTAIFALALLPTTAALALPAAPVQATPYDVSGALLDQVVKTTATVQVNKAQGVLGYNLTLHDDKYQYVLPICSTASMLQADGSTINDPGTFVIGDTLALSIQPDAPAPAKSCISRIVRQAATQAASSGECLQGFQVKHAIEGLPDPLKIKTEYTYLLNIYARPTLDCDGQAYGSSPITTVIAPNKPFIITLQRNTPNGTEQLTRWSLATDNAGQASFAYTFAAPADSYKFSIMPGGTAVAGDVISWGAKVIDPNPSPSPTPVAAASTPLKLSIAPVVATLVIVLLLAIGAEGWHLLNKKRSHELPEQEYERTRKL